MWNNGKLNFKKYFLSQSVQTLMDGTRGSPGPGSFTCLFIHYLKWFYCFFIKVLLLRSNYNVSEKEGWDPINRFNPATFLCLSLDFQHHISWYFLCSIVWGEQWLFALLILVNLLIWFILFNATFSNISAISLRPVLVVEEAWVPGENHRPWASNW